jgi:hypothetical protein
MTNRRLSGFIDALVEGRRPKDFDATPEETEVMRAAVDLRAARPGDDLPDPAFVSGLFDELSAQATSARASIAPPTPMRRRRVALVSIAAALTLISATAVTTEATTHGAPAPSALQAPRSSTMRTGTFETSDGQVLGQIVAYRGSPSWVFMNVGDSRYTGAIVCKLQVADGSTVATGTFQLHAGKGAWSKTIHLDISKLRGAQLVTSSGTVVASATLT